MADSLVASDRLAASFRPGRPALICYLPLGDPAGGDDLPQLYRDCGVDILEIGVPGSDPYLDGRTISDSVRRARFAGVNTRRASELIAAYREELPDLGMLWMTYPPDDPAGLVDAVVASGVDGFLTPARGYGSLARQLEERGVDYIHFLLHDPLLRDVQAAVESNRGFVMLQANPGPTGLKPVVLPDSSDTIVALRRLGLTAPVAMGIGIGNVQQARAAVAMGADGVIVGSLTVEALLAGRDELASLLRSMRGALDGN
jgi:tryptophan synthase alpha chain